MLLTTAIVSGPAHSIAQRWLAGHPDRPLTLLQAVTPVRPGPHRGHRAIGQPTIHCMV